MAPEVLQNKTYNGQAVDVFRAGVVLFMMVSRSKAFLTTAKDDAYYTKIRENRPSRFWKLHSVGKSYSDDFKRLVTSMLAYDPIYRLSISEIKAHPWYLQPVPSKDEIEDEFARRTEELMI